MTIEDLEHLHLVIRLLRIAGAADAIRPDQAEVLDMALAAFLDRYQLNPAATLPLLELPAFPDRDKSRLRAVASRLRRAWRTNPHLI